MKRGKPSRNGKWWWDGAEIYEVGSEENKILMQRYMAEKEKMGNNQGGNKL